MLKEFKADIKALEQLCFYVFRFDLGQVSLVKKKIGLKQLQPYFKLSRGCLAGNFSDFLRTAFLIKTSRLLGFLMFSGGIERNQWH